ncbi:iron-siderophore ABC transporter substrate-binding protein [Halobacillus salinarum]|uniref:Iron-siderophore ABC transporter substrate-binding protein n=1 Tax=Halobacillus salinarum TaxID=2932257 RepID=A0ABY4EMM5_9BACI|nr:iron-siderophore ABC transporter substrate-binding protein [Halobacillus salinarum]UOQ44909.1 iron-siderophore ABC transporter substrate-binding protein [Halobacillus salinarum]
MGTKRISYLTALIILSSLLFIIGCSSESSSAIDSEKASSNPDTSEEEAASDSKYPITIEHAFGETVIESKPERVATVQWGNHDVALALGVVPVGFSAANYGVQDDSGLLPWTKEKLDELGVEDPNIYQDTDGLDFEAISDSNPDVILAGYSGITQEDYDTLSQIAPVVPYKEAPWETTWREQVTLDAKGMGMEEKGKKLIEETEALIKEKVSQYPELQGKKVAFATTSADDLSKIYVYTPDDPRGAFLEELGMEYPESLKKEMSKSDGFSLTVSAENADILNDADIIVSYGDEQLYQTVKEDPLLGKIPAIKRGSVVFIGNGTPLAASLNPNPLAISYTIDEYLKLLSEAADKVNE